MSISFELWHTSCTHYYKHAHALQLHNTTVFLTLKKGYAPETSVSKFTLFDILMDYHPISYTWKLRLYNFPKSRCFWTFVKPSKNDFKEHFSALFDLNSRKTVQLKEAKHNLTFEFVGTWTWQRTYESCSTQFTTRHAGCCQVRL